MSRGRGKPPQDPFEALRQMRARLPSAPPPAPPKKEPPPPPQEAVEPPPDPAAEAALFEREAESQGVTPARSAGPARLPHAPGPAAGEARPAEPELAAGAGSRLHGDRRALASRLDLHGCTEDSALAQVRDFLARHRDLGSTEVLIVTGHGERRGLEGVLRPAVQALLAKHPGVAHALPDGPGAFRVTLRSRSR